MFKRLMMAGDEMIRDDNDDDKDNKNDHDNNDDDDDSKAYPTTHAQCINTSYKDTNETQRFNLDLII